MSRRKQHKPQHIQSDLLSLDGDTDDASLRWDFPPAVDLCAHVCSQCCAEFSSLSDLEQHQNDCSPCLPVLIVNENEDLLSSKSFPAASLSASCWAELEPCSIPSQDRSTKSVEFINYLSSNSSVEGPESIRSDQCSSSSSECKTDTVLCTSVFPASLPQSGCPVDQGGYSWMTSNMIIENLESTKVAMSQCLHSDGHHSKSAISSLLQQLLALQIQQIHQLQLIDQIRHQVLLYASHRPEIPETMALCTQDQTFSKSTDQLKVLSAHLSQQLAAAAGIAKCLSTQSANMIDFKLFTGAQQSQTGMRDLLSSLEASRLMTSVHKQSKLNFLSQTKMSSLMFSNNSFINKASETSKSPQPSSTTEDTASNTIQNISAVVEDLDALAALAQQSLSEPKVSLQEAFFKRKCRLCTKVFGSDSALQIHLRSHTGERPYKCNICGNRFSTRGNLKVHFQRHRDRYPCVQMNPHPLPKHVDNGICHTTSLSPEMVNKHSVDRTPSPVTTSFSLEQLESLIKKEEQPISITIPPGQLNFDSPASTNFKSTGNPAKASDSAETKYQRPMNPKSEDVQPLFKFMSEESVVTNPNPSSFKDTKLQPLPENCDKRLTGLNECIICHRILSCQSALRMHYRTHTGERPYQCKQCSRAFTTKGNLKTHQAVHRTAIPSLRVQHSCPICQRKFTNAVVLQQHIQMHMEGHSSDIPRQDCKEIIVDRTKLNGTFLYGNNGSFCKRFKCLSTFSSPTLFENNPVGAHKKTSNNGLLKWIKTERLDESNEEFCQTKNQPAAESAQWTSSFPLSESQASTSRLDEPIQTWFDPSTLTLCTPVTTSTNLKLFTNMGDSPSLIPSPREKGIFKNCNICGKNFACQSALNIHYRSHTKERPFICTTCNRGFSTKGNLKQHMLTHQIRDFLPGLLEPSYPNQPQALKTEMNASVWNGRGHDSLSLSSSTCPLPPPRRMPKQHHCKTCGKSFSSSSALQIHERTHTGERPFACTVCGRAFTTKGNLKVHMGTHMWNSAPSRRGRRLSVDRSTMGIRTRPVKLPEPPQKQSAMNSNTNLSHWNRSQELFSTGFQTNDICEVQSGGSSHSLSHKGPKDTTPPEFTAVNLGKLLQVDQSDLFVVYGRNNN